MFPALNLVIGIELCHWQCLLNVRHCILTQHFRVLKIRQWTVFMQFRNVDQRVSRLEIMECLVITVSSSVRSDEVNVATTGA